MMRLLTAVVMVICFVLLGRFIASPRTEVVSRELWLLRAVLVGNLLHLLNEVSC